MALLRNTGISAREASCERSDRYVGVIARLNDRWRVIICKHQIQWKLQKRKAEGGPAGAWRGVRYYRTGKALIEACAPCMGPVPPSGRTRETASNPLPAHFPIRWTWQLDGGLSYGFGWRFDKVGLPESQQAFVQARIGGWHACFPTAGEIFLRIPES